MGVNIKGGYFIGEIPSFLGSWFGRGRENGNSAKSWVGRNDVIGEKGEEEDEEGLLGVMVLLLLDSIRWTRCS